MNTLVKLLKANSKKEVSKFVETVNECKSIDDLLESYYTNNHFTPAFKRDAISGKIKLSEVKKRLIERKKSVMQTALNEKLQRVETVKNSRFDIMEIDITVDWSTGSIYGWQAQAEIKVSYSDNSCEYFTGSRTGGCGYDKTSTAIANALNQSNALMNKMYKAKNKALNKGENLPYGSGYGVLPYFEHGVGESCYYSIFETLDLKFNSVFCSSKKVDIYRVTKLKK